MRDWMIKMDFPKVSIIIPIHNGIELTRRCLDSLQLVNYPNYEIVVVDDGSTDNSFRIISLNYPYVKLLRGDGNLWWSGANNLAIKFVLENGTDFILLINNDNLVEPNFISELIKSHNTHGSNSIICSKVYVLNRDKIIFFAGGSIDWSRKGLSIDGYFKVDDGAFDLEKPTQWAGGMGILIPSSVFIDGIFFDDKKFPQYYGDADFFIRACKHKYQLFYCPTSIIWNDISQTGISVCHDLRKAFQSLISKKSKYNLARDLAFYSKHAPVFYTFKYISIKYLRFFIKSLIYQVKWRSK